MAGRDDRVRPDRPRSERAHSDRGWKAGPRSDEDRARALVTRVLSGVQPSGDLHLGNYLGAFRGWVEDQFTHDSFYCVVDLHALAQEFDSATLAQRTLDTATSLLAAGLDPDRCTLFVQSHVPEHPRLAWLLECTATYGELRRMTQFKDKAKEQEKVPAGLLTYPVLMAADIVLYDADRVPVGEDQRQHLELTRDIAMRFNNRFGETFVVPQAAIPKVAARVMDLQEPERKMSKSVSSPLGTVLVLDPPEEIERKVRKAVTDAASDVAYDPQSRPGASNLLDLLAAATGENPRALAGRFSGYGDLKKQVAEAMVEMLRPVRERYEELSRDRSYVSEVLEHGASKARDVAAEVLDRAMRNVGLLAPPGGFSAS